MKKTFYLLLFFALLAFASCSKSDSTPVDDLGTMVSGNYRGSIFNANNGQVISTNFTFKVTKNSNNSAIFDSGDGRPIVVTLEKKLRTVDNSNDAIIGFMQTQVGYTAFPLQSMNISNVNLVLAKVPIGNITIANNFIYDVQSKTLILGLTTQGVNTAIVAAQ